MREVIIVNTLFLADCVQRYKVEPCNIHQFLHNFYNSDSLYTPKFDDEGNKLKDEVRVIIFGNDLINYFRNLKSMKFMTDSKIFNLEISSAYNVGDSINNYLLKLYRESKAHLTGNFSEQISLVSDTKSCRYFFSEIVKEYAAYKGISSSASSILHDIYHIGSYTQKIFPNLYLIRHFDLNDSHMPVGSYYEKAIYMFTGSRYEYMSEKFVTIE
jgi:hypothetical protein